MCIWLTPNVFPTGASVGGERPAALIKMPFDIAAARLAGMPMDRARATGHSPGFADLAIAATAHSRDLTVLTCEVRHFAPLDIRVMDPPETLPA